MSGQHETDEAGEGRDTGQPTTASNDRYRAYRSMNEALSEAAEVTPWPPDVFPPR